MHTCRGLVVTSHMPGCCQYECRRPCHHTLHCPAPYSCRPYCQHTPGKPYYLTWPPTAQSLSLSSCNIWICEVMTAWLWICFIFKQTALTLFGSRVIQICSHLTSHSLHTCLHTILPALTAAHLPSCQTVCLAAPVIQHKPQNKLLELLPAQSQTLHDPTLTIIDYMGPIWSSV